MEKLLELTKQGDLLNLNPTMEEKHSYDTVICKTNALSTIRDRHDLRDAFQKLTYLAKNKFIFKWHMNRTEHHGIRENGSGKRHLRLVGNRWTSTGLFIERAVNIMGFDVVDNYTDKKGAEIVTAKRMPYVVLQEGQHPHDFPYHTIVSVPLDYEYYKWIYALFEEKTALPKGWEKEAQCLHYIANFHDWKFNPVFWCLHIKRMKGGSHRTWMAPRLGRESIDVMTMYIWWFKGYKKYFPFPVNLLYDWGWKKYTEEY